MTPFGSETSLDELRTVLNEALLASLPQAEPGSRPELLELYALLRDYPERGGKQLRGLLLLLSCSAHGGDWQKALPVAVALELFQNWVLIHDDIEDDSEERRGRPALHKQVGMPIALNVGDLLHLHMWDALRAGAAPLPRERDILNEVSRTIRRTAEGQHLDLTWVHSGRFDLSEDNYLEMVALKTAYYTVISPLKLGAIAADQEPDGRLEGAGRDLGVAFQIRDDVLNLHSDEGQAGYGKEFAGDLYEAKRTLILAETFARATRAERDELTKRLGQPRSARTAEDVAYCLTLIHRYEAIPYAQRVAEAKAEAGLQELGEAFGSLANQRVAQELTGLLESLAQRRR